MQPSVALQESLLLYNPVVRLISRRVWLERVASRRDEETEADRIRHPGAGTPRRGGRATRQAAGRASRFGACRRPQVRVVRAEHTLARALRTHPELDRRAARVGAR